MNLDKLNEDLQNYFNGSTKEITVDSGFNNVLQELLYTVLDFPETPNDFSIPVVKQPEQYEKVILVSGGADSTIMWHVNKDTEDKVGLFVNVGQKYSNTEEESVRNYIPEDRLKIVDSAMFSSEEWKHIIPNRNFFLMCEAEKLCKHEGEIWLGAVQGETNEVSGDKSEKFFRLFERLIWLTKRKFITIKTLKDKTKNDWLKQYVEETGDTSIVRNTITCFDGSNGVPCGKCQACVRKKISMEYCGIKDNIFEVDPFVGGKQYIEKYKKVMQEALDNNDFTHYSKDRCIQDLKVINDYEENSNTGL